MTRISVCMPTYNGEKFLHAQIETILSELGPGDEVVVQDDGSTDGTLRLLESLSDPRIKIEKNTANRGVVRTIERALQRATGDIVFLADQDDVWCSGRVREAIELHAEYDLVVVDCAVVDPDLKTTEPSFFASRKSGPGFFRNLYKNSFLGCCMSMRRSLLQKALPIPEGIPQHDTWIGLVASGFGRVKFLEKRLVLYRRHSNALSPTATGKRYPLAQMLRIRYEMARGMTRLLFKGIR